MMNYVLRALDRMQHERTNGGTKSPCDQEGVKMMNTLVKMMDCVFKKRDVSFNTMNSTGAWAAR